VLFVGNPPFSDSYTCRWTSSLYHLLTCWLICLISEFCFYLLRGLHSTRQILPIAPLCCMASTLITMGATGSSLDKEVLLNFLEDTDEPRASTEVSKHEKTDFTLAASQQDGH
jgi:hypothetical protein